MECCQSAAWTSNRCLLVASHIMAFPGRPTNPARPYSKLRSWKAAVFFCLLGCKPCLTPQATPPSGRGYRTQLGAHMFRPQCVSTLWRHTNSLLVLPAKRPQNLQSPHQNVKGYSRLFCFFYSDGTAPPTTATSSSELSRRCLLYHAKLRLNIYIMDHQCPLFAHMKCSGISRYVANR